jgi:hypothetical protein
MTPSLPRHSASASRIRRYDPSIKPWRRDELAPFHSIPSSTCIDNESDTFFEPRPLFRRDASRYASPAHLYCASGMAFLRGCYHQILGPRRHLPKFANGLCSHSDVWVHLHPHLIWQATKSYVERGNAFGLISHKGFLIARYRQLTAGTPYNLSTLPATGRRPIRSGRPYCLLLQRTAGPYMGAIRVERARSRRSITLCEAARSVHARLSQHRLRWHSNAHFRPPRQSVVLSGIAKGRIYCLTFWAHSRHRDGGRPERLNELDQRSQ